MKLKELAELLGKDIFEVSEMLRKNKVINIKLSEREKRATKDELKIMTLR
jgi:phosphoribosylformylglycinamidine (FGAM) synthase PurS component